MNNTLNTVHSLRKAGNQVRVNHKRRYFDPVNKRWSYLTQYERSLSFLPDYATVHAKGGFTEVSILTKRGAEINGVVKCSKNDAYVKKVGVRLAIESALKIAEEANVSLA
jgi:hypothetical protein